MEEGRSCPLAYRYSPSRLGEDPIEVTEDVLYIVGGLYGNIEALDEIERMADEEVRDGRRVRLVFNGDFNWFNASDDLFREINARVLRHMACLGNVEYELANPSPGAGCGCAYPDFVDQGVVERSNRIISRLQDIARGQPDLMEKLGCLPRFRCLIFGGLKILVLHGDPESLAGWGLAHEAFAGGNQKQLESWFAATGADAMVCTHTCLPVLWSGSVEGRKRVVVNNGSAGMGNLSSDCRGLIARVSASGGAVEPLVATDCHGVQFSLQPVSFDHEAWMERFDAIWPADSDAALSYRNRLLEGTTLQPANVRFLA